MLPGVAFRETMSGHFWRLDAPTDERAIAVALDIHARDLAVAARDRVLLVGGTIDAERLATGRPVEGTVTLKLLQQGRVHYRFGFEGDDGRRYELGGQKEWSGLAPVASLTLLTASLYGHDGEEIARATLRFDVRADWARWLRSFRLLFGQSFL
jgi:hypothetical protein